MDTSVKVLIILGVISGVSHGAGVLPDSLTALVGESMIFTTTVTPPVQPFLVVTWSFVGSSGVDSSIITSTTENRTNPAYTDRITLFRSTGSLELRNLSLTDSGEYTVLILTDGAGQQKGKCKLAIYAPVSNVKLTASSTEITESSSSSVRLSCSSSGSSLSFLWLNGSSEVSASDRVQLTDGGATLTIVRVTRYDQGPYRCHVFNTISNGTSDPLKLSISYGPENIKFTVSPSQEHYVEGSDVSLMCSANSRPSAQFEWFLNGGLLPHTGPELRLKNIQISQSGNYNCQAFNNKTLKRQTSQLAAVTVLAPVSSVKVNSSSTEITESSSSSVRLSCSSSGSSLSFLWLNGSSEVSASDRVQLTDGGATLTIVRVTRFDQGPYRCHVFNTISNGTSDPINLYVVYGPENINLTRSPSQEHYDEGADINLVCSVDSRPVLIEWFLNGELLPHVEPELRLVNVHKGQSGNYSCRAFNSKTMRNQTSQIETITILTSDISNVVVTPNITELSELSDSVSLSCSSSGSFPSFLWLNSSSEVTASERVQLTDEGATLTIINVTRYDEGPFRCHVFNNFSNYTSAAVKLSINYGPENINLKASPSGQYYEKGSNISLMCTAGSRPAALFTWFLNGVELPHSEPELRLMNIQLNQSGNYSCQAFNSKTLRRQTSQAAVVFVQIAVSDAVLLANNTDLFESNSSVILSCSASGSSLSFLWLNGSSEVTASDRVQLTNRGSTLTIANLTRYDQGPFRCNVSNGISEEISRAVNLFIQYGPDNVAIEGPDSVHVGDFTMLYCSTMSVPSAKITWLFNGEPTNSDKAVHIIRGSRGSDGGTYTCTAVNDVTGQSQTANHELIVVDFSNCDSSAAAAGAAFITAGCFLAVAAVIGIIVCVLRRRKRSNSGYPTHQREVLSIKQKNIEMYKTSGTLQNDLYSRPMKNQSNEE